MVRTLLAVLALALWPCPAHADEQKAACLEAFSAAQELRDEGKLLAERARLEICAADGCPDVVRRKCVEWLPENAAATPSVVLRILDAEGQSISDATMELDGAVVEDLSEPIELDPGEHDVAVTHPSYVEHSRKITLRPGDKARVLAIELVPNEPPSPDPTPAPPRPPIAHPAPPSSPRPNASQTDASATPPEGVAAFIAFGVAGAALVAGAGMGIYTLVRADDLEDECATEVGCARADIQHAERVGDAATAMFVVAGAAALVGAGILLFSDDGSASTADAGVRLSPAGIAVRF